MWPLKINTREIFFTPNYKKQQIQHHDSQLVLFAPKAEWPQVRLRLQGNVSKIVEFVREKKIAYVAS